MKKNAYIYNKVKSMAVKAMLFVSICPLATWLLASCGAENTISTLYPCQFIFYTQYHPGSDIETALNGPGTYVMVSAKKVNAAWNIYTTLNDGKNKTNTIVLSTAKENYANYSYLGANNGFILGTSNFNGRVAWDRQCPNCISQYTGTDYPLSWTGNRQFVNCAKCKRTYSLENGTVTEGGQGKEDKSLMQYKVAYSGIGSILTVGN